MEGWTQPDLLTANPTGTELVPPLAEQINDFIVAAKRRVAMASSVAVLITGIGSVSDREVPTFNVWQRVTGRSAMEEPYALPTRAGTEVASVSIPARITPLGKKVSLREAWHHAGQVMEQAESRRQKEREEEARAFFELSGDLRG